MYVHIQTSYIRPNLNSLEQLNISLATLKEQSNDSIIWLTGNFNPPNIDLILTLDQITLTPKPI